METTLTIKTRYQPTSSKTILFSSKEESTRSRTKQAFAKEADINTIMRRYDKTGLLVDPASINSGRFPQYGDFSDGNDLLSIENRVAQAHHAFSLLPSNIRAMFDNDPANILDFMSKSENFDEAVELGLIDRPEAVEANEPTTEPTSTIESPETPVNPAEPAPIVGA